MGAGVVALSGNTTNGTQYLYVGPWAFRAQNSETVGTTIARVIVGTYTATVWAAQNPFATTATWEVFDLSTLALNPQFALNGWVATPGRVYPSGALAGQSTLGGYQIAYAAGSHGCVLINAADAQFEIEHNCTKTLNDPTSWSLGIVDSANMGNNNYGGAFTGSVLYPAAPVNVLVQISGL
jgi:hypothetical protein